MKELVIYRVSLLQVIIEKIKENKKINKHLDNVERLWKKKLIQIIIGELETVPKSFEKRKTTGIRNQRKNWDDWDHRIPVICKNYQESPVELKEFAVIQFLRERTTS